MEARVVRISLAPVKAMALVHPEEVVVGAIGVVGNRRFWLRDENETLFNAKREGRLLQIRPEWDESSRRLSLTFPDGTSPRGPQRAASVRGQGHGVHAGPSASGRSGRAARGRGRDRLRRR